MHVVVTSHWNRFIAIMLILIRCIDGIMHAVVKIVIGAFHSDNVDTDCGINGIMHAVVKIVIGAFHSDNVDTDCGINGIQYVLVSVMSSLRKYSKAYRITTFIHR